MHAERNKQVKIFAKCKKFYAAVYIQHMIIFVSDLMGVLFECSESI